MPKNTSITLSDHFNEFLAKQVASGRFGNVSEVIRASLRLFEEREVKLEELRAELKKGEESGWHKNFDLDGFFNELTSADAA